MTKAIVPAILAVSLLHGAAPEPQDSKVDQAIARGIQYLMTQQGRDGAFPNQSYNQTAMTSLALMAVAAVGHQPSDETREGRAMNKALQFVLRADRQDPEGYFGGVDGSRMYGHGITTLMLGELLGMGVDTQQDKQITARCRKAVELILRAQKIPKDDLNKGGWRYQPDSWDSDLSATIWQVMALRSAKNAGMDVPKAAIDDAVAYIKRCYYSPRGPDGSPTDLKSTFAYGNGRAPVYSTAAAGLLALQMCGSYEGLEVTATTEWLRAQDPDPDVEWFYYGTYYYAQGMYQRGGEAAAQARKKMETLLIARQSPDGSWAGRGREVEAGTVYTTSLAVLSLAVKYHYLPIYQR